jgi:regulator of telomere elongation helicase 1
LYFTGKERLTRRIGESLFNIEDIKKEGRRCGGCPYYASRLIGDKADLVFAPFNYLVDPGIRENMGIDLKNAIVIIDEAHNIEDFCRSAGSIELNSKIIEIIQNEVVGTVKKHTPDVRESLISILKVLSNFKSYGEKSISSIKQGGSNDSKIIKGKNIIEELRSIGISREDVEKFKSSIGRLSGSESGKELVTTNTLHTLESLIFVLEKIFVEMCESYAFALQHKRGNTKFNQALFSINFWLLDPSLVFLPLAEQVRSIILLSGTLSPFTSFSSELNHTFKHMIEAPHIISPSQIFVCSVSKGHLEKELIGKYNTSETHQYLDQISKIVVDVSNISKGGTLVFVPSYSFQENLSRRLSSFRPKNLFVEPRDNFDDVLKKYNSKIKMNEPSIFLCVYRGRASEGMDFKDSSARAVIAVGIPFPSYKDLEVECKREYNDKFKSVKGREWYETQAYRAINQAIGRCIRHKSDWGAVFLLDVRYQTKRVVDGLPRWVKENYKSYSSYSECEKDFLEFVKSKA